MPRRCRAVPRGLPERPCNSPHLPSMDELQLLPLLGLAASQQASNVAHTKIWIIIVNLDRHHHRRGRLEAACAVSASRPQRGTPALLIARSCSALCAVSLLLCTWAHNPSIAQIQIPDQLPAPTRHHCMLSQGLMLRDRLAAAAAVHWASLCNSTVHRTLIGSRGHPDGARPGMGL